ncbi:hypothetical protein EDB87DRAFT_1169963 [Lactarius vividus]|nr:hypothetical protein EDB87DRAFT_1169963 [Lactarius vividus]
MVQGGNNGISPTHPSYILPYTLYTPTNFGATLPISDFAFNDDRQRYHHHCMSSLPQEMVHQQTSRVNCVTTDNQPYTGPGDIYNQVQTPQKTRVTSAVLHSVSNSSHDCQDQLFCINAPNVPNGATTFYNDHSNFVILHHSPLPPPPSAGRQQHILPIPSSPLANNCRQGSSPWRAGTGHERQIMIQEIILSLAHLLRWR